MPRLDVTPLTAASSQAVTSANELNRSLDNLQAKHAALVKATEEFNAAIDTASTNVAQSTTDITTVRDTADGMLGQGITLPSPVAPPAPLPDELARARSVKLNK